MSYGYPLSKNVKNRFYTLGGQGMILFYIIRSETQVSMSKCIEDPTETELND